MTAIDISQTIDRHNTRYPIPKDTQDALIQIARVTVSVENLAEQLKIQNLRMEKLVDTFAASQKELSDSFEARQRALGERIGSLEKNVHTQTTTDASMWERFKAHEADLDKLKNKGAKIYDGIVEKLIMLLAGGVGAYFLARLGFFA